MEKDPRYVDFRSAVEQIYRGDKFESRKLSKLIRSVIDLIDEEREDRTRDRDLINLDKFMDLACYIKTLNSSLNDENEKGPCELKESIEVIGDYLENQENIFRKYST